MSDRSLPKSNPIRRASAWWKPIARKIGDFQARVILTLMYFTVFAPFAIAIRRFADPLAIKPGSEGGWRPRNESTVPGEAALRQF
jgi:hypothetical protein